MATLNTQALKTLLDSNIPLILLDARSGKYDDGLRIPGAHGIGAKPNDERLLQIVPSKDSLIVTYCSNLKCPASKTLVQHLKELGYKNILEYPHGIEAWTQAGHVTEKLEGTPQE